MEPADKPPVLIGIAGAGTMGPGIAQVCLSAGLRVLLLDSDADALARAAASIRRGLEILAAKGRLGSADEAMGRLELAEDPGRFAPVDWVIEAVVERAAVKEALLARLGEVCSPQCRFGSNTSSISITRLGLASGRPDRFIGLHFFNPPPLMPLIEIIPGLGTGAATVAAARDLATGLGKTPVEAIDRPGFISNRILMPLINEAIRALDEGVGSVEAIDAVARLGFNHPMGPLTLADLIGLDVCLQILEVLRDEFGDPRFSPSPLLRRYVEAGWLGRKSGRGFYDYAESGAAS